MTVQLDHDDRTATYIEQRLGLLRERVRLLVERRSAGDPTAEDPFRGLYLAPETAAWLAEQGSPLPYRDAVHDRAVEDLGEGDGRLRELAAAFGLDELDVEILLVAAAPDIDRSFESLYGYLNDDVSRRRATVGLVLDLCGCPAGSAAARARFASGAPLVASRLLIVEEAERPFLGRSLRVPDRVTDHLLGGDTLDGDLVGVATLEPAPSEPRRPTQPGSDRPRSDESGAERGPSGGTGVDGDDLAGLTRWLAGDGSGLVYLREERPGAGVTAACRALGAAGTPVLRAEPGGLDADKVPVLLREARLRGAGVVVGPLDGSTAAGALVRAFGADHTLSAGRAGGAFGGRGGAGFANGAEDAEDAGGAVRAGGAFGVRGGAGFANGAEDAEDAGGAGRAGGAFGVRGGAGFANGADDVQDAGGAVRASGAVGGWRVPVVLAGAQPFEPSWSQAQPLVLEISARTAAGAWEAELARAGVDVEGLGFDLAAATATYRFDVPQIRGAVRAAVDYAVVEDVPLAPVHLHRGARLQNATGLQKHARRIRPAVGWDDLVLPDEQRGQLLELVSRARNRDRVLGDWRLRAGGGRGRGVVAMFAGESGTGKTMSSEVVAADLGLDLYVVELSAVVDKYVGETEKNLEKIFTEAGRLDAVLLFDEADAVFGKRSEVKDSHDRYANLESAYLLQRLESFDGIAILTTNLRANIDDAFTRRLDLVVDFPFPDARQRRALWEHALAPPVPCGDDIDLDRCAREFELAGGSIRGAATTAAYLAAGADRPVSMEDVLAGARREYRKIGRLLPGDMEY
ncbi:ATP-binding protein [Actinomadura gamaensis]|uniref:ATP-binding protein n=1 Tax=Actinomadura gamaensis TaxID=1763541 RepID=A0ABV9U1W2_9ACTN